MNGIEKNESYIKYASGIYLDNAASTPVDSRVIDSMIPFFSEIFGNPSSLHRHGVRAGEALAQSRKRLSETLGVTDKEIIFTSSGTESNNLALKGYAFANRKNGNHLIVSAIEHPCILESGVWLRSMGFEVTVVPVDSYGIVDPDSIKKAIKNTTILVSIMHANNEIGVIQPIDEIGLVCKAKNVAFHTDACQSFGKIPFSPVRFNADMATISSHKIYGPKGIAALYIRKGLNIVPWQHGGGHEFGLRSATENVSGIVGFAAAAEICIDEMPVESKRLTALRERIFSDLESGVQGMYINGHRTQRLPVNVNIGFSGLEGLAPNLLLALDEYGISVSTGSACSSHSGSKASHVLTAIGRNPVEAIGALRITIGRFTTDDEVTYFIKSLKSVLKNFRSKGIAKL